MKRNNLLTTTEKYSLIAIISIPFGALLIALLQQNMEIFTSSTFFVAYFIFICFSLPSLLSKVVFKQNFFSLTSVLCFLYFPLIYIFGLITHHLYGVDFQNYYFEYGTATILLWHILISLYILKAKICIVEQTLINFTYALIPFVIFLFVMIFVRSYGSIISTDILTHKTVLNGMEDPSIFGLMPATYSNTFTGQGYPILMYHTFLYMISNSFSLPFHLVGFFTDLCLSLMFALVTFRLFFKYYNPFWAVVGTTLALFTFENLAYTTHFFIPQTLAFFFFLKILSSKSQNLKELTISGLILTITHLFIGPFLTALLLIKYLYFEKKLLKGEKNHNFLFVETFLLFAFILLLNAAGFSIEKYFQRETIDWFGNLSNPEFLNKLPVLFNLLGAMWLLILPSFVRVLIKKKRTMPELIGYFGILISVAIYFLSPTFASKFFLGFGIFASLLLISWLKDIDFGKIYFKTAFVVVIILAYIFNFSTQFLELTRFLEQDNGQRSALVEKDNRLVEYWEISKPECVLISDPQTQLAIHSVGKGVTARGMYMTLDSRTKLAEFVRDPSQKNLIKALEIEELDNIETEKICIDISQRLIEMSERNQIWERLISTYQVEHKNEYLELKHPAIALLNIYPVIYIDDYHAVFLVRGVN